MLAPDERSHAARVRPALGKSSWPERSAQRRAISGRRGRTTVRSRHLSSISLPKQPPVVNLPTVADVANDHQLSGFRLAAFSRRLVRRTKRPISARPNKSKISTISPTTPRLSHPAPGPEYVRKSTWNVVSPSDSGETSSRFRGAKNSTKNTTNDRSCIHVRRVA